MKKTQGAPLIRLGTLVQSRCGRDAGRKYIVVGCKDAEFVYCSDGGVRKIANPKLKRLKHVAIIDVARGIGDKLDSNQKVFDSQLYSAIKSMSSGQ
jgi:ribosomal protein L14E/L6E/L27E